MFFKQGFAVTASKEETNLDCNQPINNVLGVRLHAAILARFSLGKELAKLLAGTRSVGLSQMSVPALQRRSGRVSATGTMETSAGLIPSLFRAAEDDRMASTLLI